jgi:hypothetical protein
MLLRVLAKARSTDGAAVGELLSAARDPLRRDEAIARGIDMAADLLAEDDSEPPAEDDHEGVDEALSELQAVESAVEESPEEALAALSALEKEEEKEDEDAGDVVPVPVPDSPAAPASEPEPEIAPPPPAPSIVDWNRWRTSPPTHRPGPTPRIEMAPTADDPASRRFDAQVVFGALGAEPSVLSRLRVLRRELSGFAGSSVETLRELVESFEDGWTRRRALSALLEAGIPERAGDALDLVVTLDRESDRRWCLGILAHRGDLQGSQLHRALDLVRAPEARQTHSLGREPQVPGVTTPRSPRKGATDCGCGVSRSHHLPIVCRRFAAWRFFPCRVPGVTDGLRPS